MTSSKPPADPRAGEFLRAQQAPEEFWAFHPRPLPPKPPLAIGADLQGRLDTANQALGRLDGITLLLPDPDQFLYTFVRKEAVLSSQIEGTQSSLSDLLLFENEAAPGVPRQDAEETANYIAALNHGMDGLRSGRLPLCNRLLREVHDILLSSGRGSDMAPGEFRTNQNWIGGSRPGNARYVPPPADQVEPMMGALEKFLHGDPEPAPILIKAALAHAQFETIHPFYDGNGRVGRMLITLLLAADGVLGRPLLYLSLFLKQNRDAYYDHLQRLRTHGTWEDWLGFFLDGVAPARPGGRRPVETGERVAASLRRALRARPRQRHQHTGGLRGRGRVAALTPGAARVPSRTAGCRGGAGAGPPRRDKPGARRE
jgi:Fic family protein